MALSKQRRQGDVLLLPVAAIPAAAAKQAQAQGEVIMALGEATGHAHRLLGDVEEWVADGVRYALVRDGVTTTHQEHDPIPSPVAPGLYEIRPQRETSLAEEWRRVVD